MDLLRKTGHLVKRISGFFFKIFRRLIAQGRVYAFRVIVSFNILKYLYLSLINISKLSAIDQLSFYRFVKISYFQYVKLSILGREVLYVSYTLILLKPSNQDKLIPFNNFKTTLKCRLVNFIYNFYIVQCEHTDNIFYRRIVR